MQRFTKTDVTRRFSEVARATFGGPVVVTQNGKDSHVVMTIERYRELLELEKKLESSK